MSARSKGDLNVHLLLSHARVLAEPPAPDPYLRKDYP